MSIGKRIRKARMLKGFTQEYVADQLNISRQAVSKWEKDVSHPDTKNLIALSELLDISVETLTMGDKPNDQSPPSHIIKFLQIIAANFLLIGMLLYGIGLFGGSFMFHVMIFNVGIPLLYYGTSTGAIILLTASVFSTLFGLILFILAYCIKNI